MSKSGEILVILFDLNSKGILKYKNLALDKDSFQIEDLLEIIVAKINIFVMQNKKNKIYLIGYDENIVQLLFPETSLEMRYFELLEFDLIKKTIFGKVINFLSNKIPLNLNSSKIIESFYKAISSNIISHQYSQFKYKK